MFFIDRTKEFELSLIFYPNLLRELLALENLVAEVARPRAGLLLSDRLASKPSELASLV